MNSPLAATLPYTLDDITAEWLTSALGVHHPGIRVDEVAVESVIWGTATKVFVRVGYATPPTDRQLPDTFCIKAGLVPELREIMGVGYQGEALFYRDIAPKVPSALPKCYFAALDESGKQGVIILDDLRAQGATFADARKSLEPNQVGRALEVQAGWHSRTDLTDEWLHRPSHFRSMVQGLFEPSHWNEYHSRASSQVVRTVLSDRDRVRRGFDVVWAQDDKAPKCLTHGDANITNVYFEASGNPLFLDWQMASMSSWVHDVALFMVGALSVDDRRTHEEELLRHYLRARRDIGGPVAPWDEAWRAYRSHHLHGLMYALTPVEMQPADVCAAMAERYAQAIVDHDTFALLDV